MQDPHDMDVYGLLPTWLGVILAALAIGCGLVWLVRTSAGLARGDSSAKRDAREAATTALLVIGALFAAGHFFG